MKPNVKKKKIILFFFIVFSRGGGGGGVCGFFKQRIQILNGTKNISGGGGVARVSEFF